MTVPRIVICLLLLLLSNVSIGQARISGKVSIDDKPLAFGVVTILNKNNIAVKTLLTDTSGLFSAEVENGSYTVQVQQLGTIVFTKSVAVQADLALGNIVVQQVVVDLDGVTVSSRKRRPAVERKVDRVIFILDNTISTSGGDALSALSIIPGVRVQNETVTIVGKGAVMILIDDRLIELREEDLSNFLKSIPAETIESIEVISTPPAKYEALGNSGLINIRLKKSSKDTWSIAMNTGYLRRKKDGEHSLSGNFLYNKAKLNIGAAANYVQGGTYYELVNSIKFPDGLWNSSNPTARKYQRLNIAVNGQYAISNNWVTGVQYIGNHNTIDLTADRRLLVYDYVSNDTIKDTKSPGTADQQPTLHAVNLFNEFTLNNTGKKIVLNADYFNYQNDDSRPYEGSSVDYNPYSIGYFKGINHNKQLIKNYAAKIDVELPLQWIKLSLGSKLSFSTASNNIIQFNSGIQPEPVVAMPTVSSRFRYNENVQAVYLSGIKKINNSFEGQAGIRMESVQTHAATQGSDAIRNHYIKLFPSLHLTYAKSKNEAIGFSYSKRIDRPTFNFLNPNVTYISPFQTLEGNPFLQPAFIDNVEFTYTYKKLDTKVYYSREKDMFNQVILPQAETNFLQLKYLNYFNARKYGISEIFMFNKFKWWTSNHTLDVNYIVTQIPQSFAEGREGLNIKMATNNDFTLNKNKTLLLNVNYTYSFPETYGVAKYKQRSNLSMALQYQVFDKKLRTTLKVNDLFKTERWRSSEVINNVPQQSNYYFDARYFQLSVSYKLGGDKTKAPARKTGNEEEKNRTGG